ncbi:16664_t:CDS:2 [Entrophospora sp. SA101]|nr:16664_t:CDS:2 [Entrophospora sp. SA101]
MLILNTGPCDDSTFIDSVETVRRQAVDVSLLLVYYNNMTPPVTDINNIDPNTNPELDVIKKHHGEIIHEPNGFVNKIYRKDSQLNRRTVNTYIDMWKEDKKDLSNKVETVSKRRWGESFHFARAYKGDTFEQSIKRHEQFLSLKLGLGPKHKAIDVGCGVGGPLREIVRLSGSHVTGINNNGYQIERCKAYSKKLGLENLTDFIKCDFTNIPCELDNKFDSAYAIEATVHAPKLEMVYGEIFRALKPGGLFASYEWVITDKYDENNPEHKQVIHGIEKGNSVPALGPYRKVLEAAKNVGFEILEYEDMAVLDDSHEPWTTHKFVIILESLHIAPPGSTDVSLFLNNTATALVRGGELEIFSPMFFVLFRKPQ